MTLAAFAYQRPRSLAEAVEAMAEAPDARWLSGGMSLLPMMKLELAAPPALLDLSGVEDLRGIRDEGDFLHIGAMTRHVELARDPAVRRDAHLASLAAERIGDPQVRNRGTVGGSLAHADPAADLPAALLALDAEVEAVSARGRRALSVQDLLLGPMMTALEPDELIVAIRIPKHAGHRQAYTKVPHPASGYAVVGVAVAIHEEGGRVRQAAIAVTGVALKAFRAARAEAVLAGQAVDQEVLAEAAGLVCDGQDVLGDVYASAAYRRQLAQVVTRRTLEGLR